MPEQFPNTLAGREVAVGPAFVLVGDPTVSNGEGMLDMGLVQSVEVDPQPSKAHGSIPGGHQLASATVDRSVKPQISLTLNDTQHTIIAALFDNATREAAQSDVASVDTTADTVDTTEDISGDIEAGEYISITSSTGNDGTYEVDSVAGTTITLVDSIDDGTADGTVHAFLDGLLYETEPKLAQPPTLVVVKPTAQGKTGAIDRDNLWFPAVSTTSGGARTYDDSEGEDANTQVDFTLMGLYREEDQAGTQLPTNARQMFEAAPAEVPGVTLGWSLPPDYQ